MSELLPCPFCGGEAQVMKMDLGEIEEGWQVWGIWCVDDLHAEEHGGYQHGHFIDNYATEAEAIEAWNTRAERTCKFLWSLADNGWVDHTCSCCGYVENTDIHVYLGYRYCPNCGAKVIDAQGDNR